MPTRAQNEIRKRMEASGPIETIQQLCLDGIQIRTITPEIKKLLESCFNIEYLTMNDCQLRSLENFPNLEKLIGLQLSDNQLTGEDLSYLTTSPQMNFLTLDCNRISSLTYLNHLKRLSDLQILQIHDNQICEEDNYREVIFEMFPKLTILDCYDRAGNQVEEQDASEYISNIENSRLDLLQFLEENENNQNDPGKKNEINLKTAVSYEDDIIERRDSIQTEFSPSVNFLDIGKLSTHNRSNFQKSGILFLRTVYASDSQSEENEELVRNFKKKFRKQGQ